MLSFNPRTRHSPAFYRSVLRIIVDGLVQKRGYEVIRTQLAASGHPSPTGSEWSLASVNGIIARMRKRSGPFYQTVLEMYLNEEITKREVAIALRRL